jgi:hypothetical protein
MPLVPGTGPGSRFTRSPGETGPPPRPAPGIAFDAAFAAPITASVSSASIDITSAAAGAWCYALLALGVNQPAAVTWAGWQQVLEGDEGASTHYALYRRRKQAGDTTFTVSWGTATRGSFGWASYTGADTAEGAAVTLHTSAGTTYPTPSLTPGGSGRWAVTFTWSRSTTSTNQTETYLPDAALAERADVNNGTNPWVPVEVADSGAPVTVAAQSYTATMQTSGASASESHGGAILLFLAPAVPGDGTVSRSFHPGAGPGTARFYQSPRETSTPPVTAAAVVLPAPVFLQAARHLAARRPRTSLAAPAPPPVLLAPAVLRAARRIPAPQPRSRITAGYRPPVIVLPLVQAERRPAARRPRSAITAGVSVTAAVTVAPAPVVTQARRRQPPRRIPGRVTTGMLPGSGVAFIAPAPVTTAAIRRQPPRRPRGAVTGPLAPAAVTAVTLPAPRIIRAAGRPALQVRRGRLTGPLAPGVSPVTPIAPGPLRATRRPPAGLSRPVRLQRALAASAFVPPSFTVGQLTAATAASSLTASGVPSGTLTAGTASGTLTAATSASGADEYGPAYGPDYGPQEGTLTATDTRTGGPG